MFKPCRFFHALRRKEEENDRDSCVFQYDGLTSKVVGHLLAASVNAMWLAVVGSTGVVPNNVNGIGPAALASCEADAHLVTIGNLLFLPGQALCHQDVLILFKI